MTVEDDDVTVQWFVEVGPSAPDHLKIVGTRIVTNKRKQIYTFRIKFNQRIGWRGKKDQREMIRHVVGKSSVIKIVL